MLISNMNRSILRGFISLAIVIASLSALPAFASVCGDGTPDPGEECDDGNLVNGDGCSSTCTIEAGFDCSAAIAGIFEENILVDGSFEDNNAGGEWTSINHSVLGPDQICGDACFGTPLAASADGSLTSGNYVLVAGGRFNTNSTGNVTHGPVSIPANAGTLEFQWATLSSGPAGDACTGASDGLTLTIGGTQVWSNLDGPVSCTNVNPYQRVVIDLATAPGGSYQGVTTDFEFTASATGIVDGLTNVMLDDVSIFIPLSPAIPPTPSACTAINCGDGLLGSTEACDDGNATSGDGCSATCQVEQPNFVCEDPIPPAPSGENISDGGLEKGSPNPGWAETGTRFEPICSEFLCGVALAKTGAFYAWFGGSDLPNDQTMTQNVQISVTATDLTFELRVGVCDSADDNLTVEIDGTEIYRYDCTAATGTYQTQTVPLGVFADGGVHALQFIGHTEATNGGNSNFNVDDISIQDNIALPWGKYGSCFELPTACRTPEQFNSGIPGDWTVINLGPDTADGWGASTDGICASRNWSPGTPDNNATGGGGPAACADSDATGQIDIDAGGAGAEQAMDTYLCSPPLDLTQVTDPQFSFLVNYQARDNDINDEELLQVLVGTDWPNGLTVGSYTNLGEVPDHLASTLELSEPAALRVDLSAFNAESSVHVCFHYRGTYAWYAQIDNAALRGSDCSAPDLDTDGDGVTDSSDNCPAISNPIQDNFDGDAEGDACDSDDDNDGQTDVDEIACDSDPLNAGSQSPDNDADNLPDCVDPDDDNDGVDDYDDAFPFDPTESGDNDRDGTGDNADDDDDNDGQTDVDEIACNSDPLDAGSTAQDSDNDNVPDCVDTDDDNDQVADADDVCPATVVPESLPTRSLGVNRFALVDGDNVFDTKSPKGKGPRKSYTISDTAGCSCTQIVEAQGLGKGHTKFGCSISAMDDWVLLVNP